MTVNEVSKLTGVSIRTLQYYDKIGLLKPAKYTESGYRRYDDTVLETLQQILLWKELENNYSGKDVCVPVLGAGTKSFDRPKPRPLSSPVFFSNNRSRPLCRCCAADRRSVPRS